MTTLPKQISLFTDDELMYSQADFPANHTARQENDLERKITAISGQKCFEQFGKFSRHGLWAKTFAGLLIGMGDWYCSRNLSPQTPYYSHRKTLESWRQIFTQGMVSHTLCQQTNNHRPRYRNKKDLGFRH